MCHVMRLIPVRYIVWDFLEHGSLYSCSNYPEFMVNQNAQYSARNWTSMLATPSRQGASPIPDAIHAVETNNSTNLGAPLLPASCPACAVSFLLVSLLPTRFFFFFVRLLGPVRCASLALQWPLHGFVAKLVCVYDLERSRLAGSPKYPLKGPDISHYKR